MSLHEPVGPHLKLITHPGIIFNDINIPSPNRELLDFEERVSVIDWLRWAPKDDHEYYRIKELAR